MKKRTVWESDGTWASALMNALKECSPKERSDFCSSVGIELPPERQRKGTMRHCGTLVKQGEHCSICGEQNYG